MGVHLYYLYTTDKSSKFIFSEILKYFFNTCYKRENTAFVKEVFRASPVFIHQMDIII